MSERETAYLGFQTLLEGLESKHQERLSWFIAREGAISNFPDPLSDGLLVASAAKAIYKPADLDVALSVRIMLESPYRDGEVFARDDGSWCVAYHQEVDKRREDDPAVQRRALWTNRSLDACVERRVPIGVLKEVEPLNSSRRSRYMVLGLALPVGWDDGMFLLEGFGPLGANLAGDTRIEALEAAGLDDPGWHVELDGWSLPADDYDSRVRVMRQIVSRRGQRRFRDALLRAYDGRCALTGCDVVDVLEAAHIQPYRGPESNVVPNGILLRADIHTLFDLQLLTIEPSSLRVVVSKRLAGSPYEDLSGLRIALPAQPQDLPSGDALAIPHALFLNAEHDRSAASQSM